MAQSEYSVYIRLSRSRPVTFGNGSIRLLPSFHERMTSTFYRRQHRKNSKWSRAFLEARINLAAWVEVLSAQMTRVSDGLASLTQPSGASCAGPTNNPGTVAGPIRHLMEAGNPCQDARCLVAKHARNFKQLVLGRTTDVLGYVQRIRAHRLQVLLSRHSLPTLYRSTN